jgi:hypothetical protein
MKRILAAAFLLALPFVASAVPFLIGDVTTLEADKCVFTPTTPAGAAVENDVVVDNVRGVAANQFRVCRYDLATVPVGAFAFNVALKNSAWGVVGPSAPFASTRPSSPPVAGSLRIER